MLFLSLTGDNLSTSAKKEITHKNENAGIRSVPPSIFKYNDYRIFLRDTYEYRKSTERSFSYREFSKLAGLKSTNFLKLVIDGDRNLTEKSTQKFTSALQLKPVDARYFEKLVNYNQAKSLEEKKDSAEKLLRSKKWTALSAVDRAQYNLYRHWYLLAIRELVSMSEFKEDPKWIAESLVPKITPQEAKDAIDDLEILGMIERNSNGALKQSDSFISTGDEVFSEMIAEYHQQMMTRASESIELVARNKREISSVTVSVTAKQAFEIKSLIQSFRKQLLSMIDPTSSGANVYQVNFQFFPLSNLDHEESE